MERLSHAQLKAVRDCAARLEMLRDPKTFVQEVLALIARVIPSDPGYNEFNDGGIIVSIRKHPLPHSAIDYLRHLGSRFFEVHPVLNQAVKMGTHEPLRLTDCVNPTEWRRSALYNECYREFGCDYQLGFVWSPDTLLFGLPLNRSKRDFSASERQMLTLLQPHLIQAHANVQAFARLSQAIETLEATVILAFRRGRIEYATPKALALIAEYFGHALNGTMLPAPLVAWLRCAIENAPPAPFVQTKNNNRLVIRAVPSPAEPLTLLLEERRAASPADLRMLGLTPRQAEVLFWLSKGKTNQEIGVILGAARNTIRNHVDHLLKKLKVENRLVAARMALEILSGKTQL